MVEAQTVDRGEQSDHALDGPPISCVATTRGEDLVSKRVTGAFDAYNCWAEVRPRARLRDDALDVAREGRGSYLLSFDFASPGEVAVLARDAVGPSGDPAALSSSVRQRIVARMDAWHPAFMAPGRRPLGVRIDDDGVGRLVPHEGPTKA